MGKELVISANRRETKVAVLEDDQLVEIYFQRANEYSLAGSIHKGRVTRVLPGMQSAFVDIGLERDAFLYVSDFFEEHEEYDRMPGLQERKGRSPAKPEAAVAPSIVQEEAQAEAGGKDRKSRRSRRRRRNKGFPATKYAPVTGEAEMEIEESEFPVLPGESLAKYAGTIAGEAETVTDEEESQAGEQPAQQAAPQEQEGGELYERPEETGAAGAERENAIVAESEGAALTQPDSGAEQQPSTEEAAAPVAEEATEYAGAPEAAVEEPFEVSSEEVAAGQAEAAEVAAGQVEEPHAEAEPASGQEATAPTAEVAAEAETGSESGKPAEAAGVDESGVDAEAAGAISESAESPEEAVKLQAGLRETHTHYPRRLSRRLRKKLQSAAAAEARAAREEPVEVPPEPEKPSTPSITDLLKEGQEVLVQIAKEPMGQKGARITSHIALPGRFVVYMPTVEHLGVSRKIASDEERQRLRRILHTHSAGMPGGFIVRTAGEGQSEENIAADMMYLYNLWLDIRRKAESRSAPALIHHDLDVVQRLLRDQLAEEFKAIWVDNEETYESVLHFVERFRPQLVPHVKLYTRQIPIFDAFNITAELEKALRPKVWLKSGGYIVVNQTEALVAIDVNTGKFVGKSNRLEDTIVKTNLEAIREIVRQIRLRDLGGIIVVDFIDMEERKNRQKIMQALEEEMKRDRAPNKILQFNDFGLVAITRKRVKQSLERMLCSPCPTCEGAGYVKSVQTVISEILQEASKMAGVLDTPNVVLRVHPDVAKVLKATNNDYLEELEETLGRPVLVTGDPTLHPEKWDLA